MIKELDLFEIPLSKKKINYEINQREGYNMYMRAVRYRDRILLLNSMLALKLFHVRENN
jgi:repressor of nif and glnA expression